MTKTNGSFFPKPPTSPFVLPAGDPAAEVAWSIGDEDGKQQFAISRAEAIKIGFNPDTMYSYPDGFGSGLDNMYPVRLDIFHHIHCLNNLRKAANPDIFSKEFHELRVGDKTLTWPEHVQHCQYVLFQMLTCQPDWGVLGFFAYEDGKGAALDFNINRKCIDWDAFMNWREENAMELTDEQWDIIGKNPPKSRLSAEDLGL
jgi:Mycotoxin biosynthesis protein UstYa